MEPKIMCDIHLGEVPISETLTLTCNHRFCSDCLVSDWTSNIQSGYVDKSRLKCPSDNCNTPITYNELKGNLPANIFDKYEEFTMKNFMIDEEEIKQKNEKTIDCPNPKCLLKVMIWKDASYFTCAKCKNQYCASCFGDWEDHKELTCEQFKLKKLEKRDKNEIAFEKLIEKEKWKKCPKCGSIVEKTEFCNYIRCKSNICQKNTCFCYLCGDILTEETHYTHFDKNNPYLDECIKTMDLKKKNKKKCCLLI